MDAGNGKILTSVIDKNDQEAENGDENENDNENDYEGDD